MDREPVNRNVIVVGASAGGVEALQKLARGLPPDLPAAIFVVLHIGEESRLGEILDRAGPLPAAEADSGEPIVEGRIYVAPPGRHLLLHDRHVLLRRGPRENLSRPAIDPLFRSAACTFGAAVIGVVLTGGLNDGAAGLRAVKSCGGIAVVQDPDDAVAPSMPRNALRHAEVDYCVPLTRIAPLLARLAAEPAGDSPPVPWMVSMEAAIAAQEHSPMTENDMRGPPSGFVCPECGGPLWEIQDGGLLRYRCRVGHALTAEAVLAGHEEEVERVLWNLLQTQEQRAALAHRMANQSVPNHVAAERLRKRALEYEEDSRIIRGLLLRAGEAQSEVGDEGLMG